MREKLCKFCVHFHNYQSTILKTSSPQCRLSINIKLENNSWPPVDPDTDWCGEFIELKHDRNKLRYDTSLIKDSIKITSFVYENETFSFLDIITQLNIDPNRCLQILDKLSQLSKIEKDKENNLKFVTNL
jgi:hypothetical protein